MQEDKGGRTIVGKLALGIEYVGSIVLFYWLYMCRDGGQSAVVIVPTVRPSVRFYKIKIFFFLKFSKDFFSQICFENFQLT